MTHELHVLVRGTTRAGRSRLTERIVEVVSELGFDSDVKAGGLFVGGTVSLDPRPRVLVEEQDGGFDAGATVFHEGSYFDAMRAAGNEVMLLRHRRDSLLEANNREVTRRRDLSLALDLALALLERFEPGDSRAVSDEFVAMAAVACDVTNDEAREILRRALGEIRAAGAAA